MYVRLRTHAAQFVPALKLFRILSYTREPQVSAWQKPARRFEGRVGIDLITVEARVVVAPIDTYLKYSEAVGQSVPVARPAFESRSYDELAAENQALRAN